jgi:hypothetical protein
VPQSFDADFQHWPTLAAFTAYLQGVPRPAWCTGITNHNTYIPNELQWRGLASMQSMRATYIAKGWSAGPHLYLCAEAPNPADTGIWQMTPSEMSACTPALATPTTWASRTSATSMPVRRLQPNIHLLLAVNRAILAWWGIPPEKVNVHNECMAGRTCPGKYLTGTQIRASLNSAWSPAPPTDPFARWGDVGKPTGAAVGFATPRTWLVNQALGKCVAPETYSTSGAYSVTEFEHGLITYFKARNVALVEKF